MMDERIPRDTDTSMSSLVAQIASCPLTPESARMCSQVIRPDWVTSAGWGNPAAKVVFLGINPRLGPLGRRDNQLAAERHRVKPGQSREDRAEELSIEGAERDSHFDLHREWLSHIRAEVGQPVPATLAEFAFFTEVAYCPSAGSPEIEVLLRCFQMNSRTLLRELGFSVIVAVGKPPLQLLLAERGEVPPQRFHGWRGEGALGSRAVVASFQPAALKRSEYSHLDRLAPARRLVELHREGIPVV